MQGDYRPQSHVRAEDRRQRTEDRYQRTDDRIRKWECGMRKENEIGIDSYESKHRVERTDVRRKRDSNAASGPQGCRPRRECGIEEKQSAYFINQKTNHKLKPGQTYRYRVHATDIEGGLCFRTGPPMSGSALRCLNHS